MEISVPDGLSSFIVPLSIFISALIISGSILYAASKTNGDSGSSDTAETTDSDTDVAGAETGTLGEPVRTFETFTEYDTEVCKQDGKPVVYLFSTTWCPHCQWVAETFDNWAKENSDKAAVYHWQIDTKDNTITSEVETEIPSDILAVYNKFNPDGSIPTFVFGCRYSRVGNGYESESDLTKEKASFDSVLGELI